MAAGLRVTRPQTQSISEASAKLCKYYLAEPEQMVGVRNILHTDAANGTRNWTSSQVRGAADLAESNLHPSSSRSHTPDPDAAHLHLVPCSASADRQLLLEP